MTMMRYEFDTSCHTLMQMMHIDHYSYISPLYHFTFTRMSLHQARHPVQQRVQRPEVHQAQISLDPPRRKVLLQQRVLEVDQASLPDLVQQRQSLRNTDSLNFQESLRNLRRLGLVISDAV